MSIVIMPLENVKDSRVLLFIVTHNRQCCFVTLGIDKNIAMHSMELLHCYTWKRQHLLQYVAYIFALLIWFFIAGDSHSSFEPRKVEVLCKKKIIDIAFGSGPHVLAVSSGNILIVVKQCL